MTDTRDENFLLINREVKMVQEILACRDCKIAMIAVSKTADEVIVMECPKCKATVNSDVVYPRVVPMEINPTIDWNPDSK